MLVAYASKCGATAEAAEVVGKVLSEAGYTVDVCPVQKVKDLRPYQAVVLGTALRMGKPIGEMINFAGKHHAALSSLPVACFSLGLLMREDTPENRQKTGEFLAPLLQKIPPPLHMGYFAGKVEYSKLDPFLRFIFSKDKSGEIPEGDWRNWDAIRAWAGEVAALPAFKE